MKFLVIMDSYKDCLPAKALVEIIGNKISDILPDADVVKRPIADGGEGTVETLIESQNGKRIDIVVNDPFFRKIESYYGLIDNTGVIESAKAIGLMLLSTNERNPLKTSSYGFGEIIKDALDKGIRDFIIGIGGSSTNDCGIGMLSALGMRFYDRNKQPIEPIGESLKDIYFIDNTSFDSRVKSSRFLIACDVDNELYGSNGAAYIYGPQKGADEGIVCLLDKGLKHFSEVVKNHNFQDYSLYPGAGAAGGLGYAFQTFFPATLKPGVEIIFEHLNIKNHLEDVDFIITGEGKIDCQSTMGKVLSGVGKLGKEMDIPVIAIAGSINGDVSELHNIGISSMFSIINRPLSLNEALKKHVTEESLKATTEEIIRLIIATKKGR